MNQEMYVNVMYYGNMKLRVYFTVDKTILFL